MGIKKNIVDYTKDIELPRNGGKASILSDSKEDALYIFFSLDICNSTKMKSDVKDWKNVILKLYNSQFEFRTMRIWKFVGDEVIFCTPYPGIDNLVSLIHLAYSKIQAVEDELNQVTRKENYNIKIKGTMWLTYVSSNADNTNIHVPVINEFLGKQIDEGFRMAQFSSSGKLLLDPKIVFILLLLYRIDSTMMSSESSNYDFAKKFLEPIDSFIDETEKKKIKDNIESINLRKDIKNLIENIYFMKYEKMKGIWGNNPYPIYWYSQLQSKEEYPSINSNEPIPLLMSTESERNKYYSRDLFSIFESVNIKSDIKKILQVIIDNKPSNPYIKSGTAQLYYSIACVKDGKVLIAKRCFSRKHLSGIWEFGFKKHTDVGTYDDICNFFFKEFGIKVTPITDGTVDNNLIPLHFCTTYRNNIKHNSILCCAEIQEDKTIDELKEHIYKHFESISKNENNTRYIEVDFVNEEDVKDKFEDLTLKNIEDDSYSASIGKSLLYNNTNQQDKNQKQKAIVYFKDSVKYVLDFYRRWATLTDKKWYNLLSDFNGDD